MTSYAMARACASRLAPPFDFMARPSEEGGFSSFGFWLADRVMMSKHQSISQNVFFSFAVFPRAMSARATLRLT
ncbi:MAG: hypothetical protein ACTHLY_05425, partial [Pseudolabrys sp.]